MACIFGEKNLTVNPVFFQKLLNLRPFATEGAIAARWIHNCGSSSLLYRHLHGDNCLKPAAFSDLLPISVYNIAARQK
jgi:hypothetical protein